MGVLKGDWLQKYGQDGRNWKEWCKGENVYCNCRKRVNCVEKVS